MTELRRDEILDLLRLLDAELARAGVCGELYLVGGALLCLAFNAGQAPRSIDGFFHPAHAVRAAARRVAEDKGLPEDWLNDAVQGFFRNDVREHLSLPNLRVLTASSEYLLAMKCLAMRIGGELRDREDARFLLRCLNIERHDAAVATIARYWPPDKIPQETLRALEDLTAYLAEA